MNKLKEEDAIKQIDQAIAELVYPKNDMQKAYNYYNGKRDINQYRFLEENYGIGNPMSIKFTPLVRKHIDAIVGEYLETAVLPKISCKDESTLTAITREKELKITQELTTQYRSQVENTIMNFIAGKPTPDPLMEKRLQELIEEIDQNFISNYEVAAQNVVQYVIQSRDTDFLEKRRMLLLDLLISAYYFYTVKPTVDNNNIDIEVLDPRNVFPDRNLNSPYIKDSHRIVVRKWLTVQQIKNQYGKDLSAEDLANIEEQITTSCKSGTTYVYTYEGQASPQGGISNQELIPGFPENTVGGIRSRMIPVYHVEWLETDKDFIMQRYSGIRIGEDIYITHDQPDEVQRKQSNKSYCCLSVNGGCNINRNKEPYSLMLACADLQDTYDLLLFYRDNIIANSGTSGDWLDISSLPVELGPTLAERIMTWQAYKKGGVAITNTSQEGRQFNANTTYAGFDDTLKVQAMQGIEMAIERVESICSSITGVFRERLNGIQQKDAVSNIKVGAQNSFIITKQFTHFMDLATMEILTDCLNLAKIVWKKGLVGSLIVGDKFQKIFQALPEHFTTTDFNVHVTSGSEVLQDMQTIKEVTAQFITAGIVPADIIVDALTSKSLSELKYSVKNAIKKSKEENNQLQQLTQQSEQLQQELKQTQQALQQAQAKIESLNEGQLQIERDRLEQERQLEMYKLQTDRNYKQDTAKNDTARTEIEVRQLSDGNPYNDQIKNK